MVKYTMNNREMVELYKRDILGRIILKRKSLVIIKFLKKAYNIKTIHDKAKEKKNYNFFRILNIPRPLYYRRKTKYGKYFMLRQQFRIYYGFLRIRTIQLIIKKSFKKVNAIHYFLYLMESRLDVLLYRLHLVSSVRMARQLIVHGKIFVNFRILRNPNYNLKSMDTLTLSRHDITTYKLVVYYSILEKQFPGIYIPNYIEYN